MERIVGQNGFVMAERGKSQVLAKGMDTVVISKLRIPNYVVVKPTSCIPCEQNDPNTAVEMYRNWKNSEEHLWDDWGTSLWILIFKLFV